MKPSFTWRLQVWDAPLAITSSPSRTLTPNTGLISIDGANLTAQGDSLDAELTIQPDAARVPPRAMIRLQTQNTPTEPWISRYLGLVTTGGNPRSKKLQTIRAAGARQRLFEKIVRLGHVPGGDVATMVRTVLNDSATKPAGFTFTNADAPTQSFQLGDRAPAYETAGDFLDAMTATVGAFAVPSGTTYTYDGRAYQPGEIVPPTQWGVRPDGSIFFRRFQTGAADQQQHAISEGDNRISVEWAEINAEGATGDPLLIYAGQLNLQEAGFTRARVYRGTGSVEYYREPPLVIPIARLRGRNLVGSSNPAHATRHQIPGPLDFMIRKGGTMDVFAGDVTNPGAVRTPGIGSSALFHATTARAAYLIGEWPASAADGVWKLVYSTPQGFAAGSALLTYGFSIAPPVGTNYAIIESALPLTNGEISTIWIPNLGLAQWGADPAGTLRPFIDIRAQQTADGPPPKYAAIGGILVYEISYYIPDCDEGTADHSQSARYADSLERKPAPEVARVTYAGLGPLAAAIRVYPAAGSSPADAPVDRTEVSITQDAGILTTYHAGQAWPAYIEEQQVLLDRLARRAVNEGGRRR